MSKSKLKSALLTKNYNLPSNTNPVYVEKESAQQQANDNTALELSPPYDFNALAELYDINTYHSRCIKVKAGVTVLLGYSIINDDANKKPDEEYKKIDDFMKNSLRELFNTQLDFEIFGNGYGELVRNTKKEISEYYHIPAKDTKLVKRNNSIHLKQVIGSKPVYYKPFEGDKYQTSDEHEFIHIKNYCPKNRYYGSPDYIAAVITMYLNKSADEYNTRRFQNNAVPDSIIEMYDFDENDNVQSDIKGFFQGNFKGIENVGKVLLLQADGNGDNKDRIKITKMGAEIKEASFRGLRQDNREEVIAAHGMPPRLIGIESIGKLGGGGEVKEQLKLFNEILAIPRQKTLARQINKIIEEGMEIKDWKVKFDQFEFANATEDAQFYKTMVETVDSNGESILDSNEARVEMGYVPREKNTVNKSNKIAILAKQLKSLRLTLEAMRDE